MVAPVEGGKRREERRVLEPKAVIVVSVGQAEKAERAKSCSRLFNSGVLYETDGDTAGDFFIVTHQPFNKESFDPDLYTIISPYDPRANPLADYSTYVYWRQKIYNQPKDLETGIRMVEDHILAGTKGKERRQTQKVSERARNLLDLYAQKFRDLSEKDFERIERGSYILFSQVDIDPLRVRDRYKKGMVDRVAQASTGEDIIGRRNWLASYKRLIRAERDVLIRELHLTHVETKFAGILTALCAERTACRSIFGNVASRLGPERGVTSTVLFRKKDPTLLEIQYQSAIIYEMVGTMSHQLQDVTHLNPYRKKGLEAARKIEEAKAYLAHTQALFRGGKEQEAIRYWLRERGNVTRLLTQDVVRDVLQKTLDDYQEIRPKS